MQHHVGPADRTLGAGSAVEFDVVLDLALVAHAGGVDGDDGLAVALEADIDAVARRAGDLADDGALALGQALMKVLLPVLRRPTMASFMAALSRRRVAVVRRRQDVARSR